MVEKELTASSVCEHSASAKLCEELYKGKEKILEIKKNKLLDIISKYNISLEDSNLILNIFNEYKENILLDLRNNWNKNQVYDILSLFRLGK